MENAVRPDHAYSVFAGQEKEATDRARAYFTGYPPSSPSIAILRDGELVYMMPRRDIESREAPAIAADLKAAFDQHCGQKANVRYHSPVRGISREKQQVARRKCLARLFPS
jgi:hypothetical protein